MGMGCRMVDYIGPSDAKSKTCNFPQGPKRNYTGTFATMGVRWKECAEKLILASAYFAYH